MAGERPQFSAFSQVDGARSAIRAQLVTLAGYADPGKDDSGGFPGNRRSLMFSNEANLVEGTSPQAKLQSFPTMTEAERQPLPFAANQSDYPCGQCLHQLIEEQAENHSQQIAANRIQSDG